MEALLDLPIDAAVRRIPATLAELIDDPDGHAAADAGGLARLDGDVLAGLGCDFTIRRPDELRTSVRALAERLARSA